MQPTMLETSQSHSAVGALGQLGGAITGATNASPIVITTTSAHGLYNGCPVRIAGVTGNTNANTTGYAKTAGYTGTTFGLYSDPGLQTPVAGNSAYVSGGTVSEFLSVSGVSGDWTLKLRIESLSAALNCDVCIQDSADGFVSDIRTIANVSVKGQVSPGGAAASAPGFTGTMKDFTWRSYDIPTARFGVANSGIRLYVAELDATAVVVTSAWYES